jgi:hypothetical protein
VSRGSHASGKRSRTPVITIIAILVVVAIGAGVFIAVRKNQQATTGVTYSAQTPHLTWTIVGVNPVSATPNNSAAVKAANLVAPPVENAMKLYYENAFLDPNAWKNAQYQHAFNLMVPARQSDAQAQVDTITAGTDAKNLYTAITPLKSSSIQIKVLVDSKGKPVTAVAIVDFKAKATTKSGGTHIIESTGQWFLQNVAQINQGSTIPGQSPAASASVASGAPQWMIIAWSATRPDIAPPSVSATPGSSATPSP